MNTTNGKSSHGCLGLLQTFRRILGYQKEVQLEQMAKPENDKQDHSLTETSLEGTGQLEKVVVSQYVGNAGVAWEHQWGQSLGYVDNCNQWALLYEVGFDQGTQDLRYFEKHV